MIQQSVHYRIELLEKKHYRHSFCCGVGILDDYFHKQASQDLKKHIATPWVLLSDQRENPIGYYTLSALSILADEFPEEITKKLSKHPILPSTLIGRLAVDQQHQGKNLGELLLMNALKRALSQTKEIGSMAVIVEAKSEAAIAFYRHYGFIQFPCHLSKLFLPMATIETLYTVSKFA